MVLLGPSCPGQARPRFEVLGLSIAEYSRNALSRGGLSTKKLGKLKNVVLLGPSCIQERTWPSKTSKIEKWWDVWGLDGPGPGSWIFKKKVLGSRWVKTHIVNSLPSSCGFVFEINE